MSKNNAFLKRTGARTDEEIKQARRDAVKRYARKNRAAITARQREYRARQKEQISKREKKYRETHNEKRKELMRDWRAKHQWFAARNQAKRRGISFSINVDEFQELYLNAGEFCPVCGCRFDGETRRTRKTVDRIRNDWPYTTSNCWIICHRCNAAKSDWTLSQLKNLVAAVEAIYLVRGLPCE